MNRRVNIEIMEGFVCKGEACPSVVAEAEAKLGLNFSEEYKDLLEKYSIFAINGHEFTGIAKTKGQSVVDVTMLHCEKYADFPKNMYVIETVGVDGLVILQDTNGYIYTYQPGTMPERICNSLEEYLEEIKG